MNCGNEPFAGKKTKNKKKPRNVEMWTRVPESFLLWGIARGKTDMVGPTMHTISLVKILVGNRPSLLSVRAQVREGNLSNSGTPPLAKTLSGISTSVHIHVAHRMWTSLSLCSWPTLKKAVTLLTQTLFCPETDKNR